MSHTSNSDGSGVWFARVVCSRVLSSLSHDRVILDPDRLQRIVEAKLVNARPLLEIIVIDAQ